MENLEIYNKVREVPADARKEINAGRLKGMTDINPQWRIEKLTELFGSCGIGWYAEETKREFVNGANDEIVCFVDINLYIKNGNEWSKPIYGTGGSSFVTKETKGLYTSDEAVKMAYTDAISVACKQLGIGADVYRNKSDSKYSGTSRKIESMITQEQVKELHTLFIKIGIDDDKKSAIYKKYGVASSKELTFAKAKKLIETLKK